MEDWRAAALRKKFDENEGSFHKFLRLRVYRALSWLEKSEQVSDEDSCFIFLWIAFNAAYAKEWPAEWRGGKSRYF